MRAAVKPAAFTLTVMAALPPAAALPVVGCRSQPGCLPVADAGFAGVGNIDFLGVLVHGPQIAVAVDLKAGLLIIGKSFGGAIHQIEAAQDGIGCRLYQAHTHHTVSGRWWCLH